MTLFFAATHTCHRAGPAARLFWILQGHRFSAGTVANLRLAFTVGLGGLQAGGRYANGNLEAPLVDGMIYILDGSGSVYAIDVRSRRKGEIKWKFDPGVDSEWAGDVASCGVNNRGVALWKDERPPLRETVAAP
jgi:alcohol dehydrogenase (cytochrome c)